MSNFTPSKFQQAIFDFIVKPVKGAVNAVISAVAGSGKTTTLLNAMALIPADKSVLFLAFNRSIAGELKERVQESVKRQVKTLHGFGLSSLNKAIKINGNPDSGKYRKIMRAILEYYRGEVKGLLSYGFSANEMAIVNRFSDIAIELNKSDNATAYINRVLTLCDLGRLNLVDTNKGQDMLTQIAYKHNVELTNGEVECALLLIKLGTAHTSVIDFTDMIYLPIALNTPVFTFDYVFVDECQDLNSAQRNLMLRAVKPNGGRFIAVGDSKQAIYGFAGADADSFRKLQDLPNTTTLPLSVSYRCGKNIIALAKEIVPELEASPNAKDGVVDYNASKDAIRSGDMVLCRNTFPLVAMCLMYLAKGVKAFVMGSEIGKVLSRMIEDTQRKSEEWTMVNVFARLDLELQKVIQNVMRKEKVNESEAKENSAVRLYEEKIKVIGLLAKGLDNPSDVIAKINKIFADDNGEGICLSTIHKSKGLEADRVFIIHQELMPSKFARKEWERVQEDNLRYVAYTRAKSYLGFVIDYDAFADNPDEERKKVEVKESQHIGQVGEKVLLEVEVVGIKSIAGFDGECLVFDLKDKDGNLFIKMGVIKDAYIISNHKEVVEGTMLRCMGVVKAHSEWRGVKTTRISTLSKAK